MKDWVYGILLVAGLGSMAFFAVTSDEKDIEIKHLTGKEVVKKQLSEQHCKHSVTTIDQYGNLLEERFICDNNAEIIVKR